MRREEVLMQLRTHRAEIAERFAVERLALFGSAARDELQDGSDVDVLVAFSGPATFAGYMGLKRYLEGLLNRQVDLVTETGLKPRVRPYVERDLVRVA